jgi:hypothetical protein
MRAREFYVVSLALNSAVMAHPFGSVQRAIMNHLVDTPAGAPVGHHHHKPTPRS